MQIFKLLIQLLVSKVVLRIVLWVWDLGDLDLFFALTSCEPRLWSCGLLQRPKLTHFMLCPKAWAFGHAMIAIRKCINLAFCFGYYMCSSDAILGNCIIPCLEVVYVFVLCLYVCSSERVNSGSPTVEFVSTHLASLCSCFSIYCYYG